MLLKRIARIWQRYADLPQRIYRIQEALGRIEARQTEGGGGEPREHEFRVFSQWGEDGIIQYLVSRLPIERRLFVEFGVENYRESNTRFLLTNNHWSGLVIDGSAENIEYIKRDAIYWASNLKAEHCFITAENINEILDRSGIRGDVGLLSIDIDGNDYWVWEAITAVSPRIVICEYNAHFGPSARLSIPYTPDFRRDAAHSSRLYYGASIAALAGLALQRGYALVAGNSAGNNAFFVRRDVMGSLPVMTPEQAYRRPVFREHHDAAGRLTFMDFEQRLQSISHLPVHDFTSGTVRSVSDALDVR